MQKRKLFIEISVPDSLKKVLSKRMEKWKELPVKWTKEENMHVMVLFLGYVDESVLPEICQKVRDVSAQFESFDIYFEKIMLAPNSENPNQIWLEGDISDELKNLQHAIEKELNIFVKEKKEFRPHITIGKLRKHLWDEIEEKPLIDETISVSFGVENIMVMESNNEKGGSHYIPIETCPLR